MLKAWNAPGFSHFYVGDPSSPTRSGGPFLIRGAWFLNHLLLQGTGRIQNFEP
jgi:hypothetical protein